MSRRTSYEVQILQDKHWIIQEVIEAEDEAVDFAESLVQKGNLDAVRVVRDFSRQDGTHSETVVMEKTGDGKGKPDTAIALVQEAPLCHSADDFLGLSARLAFGRLARKYLDEMVLTPTELLHNAAEMKRFADKDRLLMTAVDSIATLQARQFGLEQKARRDALYKAWDQGLARARALAALKLPEDKSFAALRRLAPGQGAERDYRLLTLMARRLIEQRAWLGKLDLLLGWSGEPEAAAERPLLDGVMADLLIPAQLVQDLLGFQPNLGMALGQICDLADGRAEAAKFAPPGFAGLNALFAAGHLPQTRQVLLSRVARELRGANPLSRNEPAQEYEMFSRLAHRLIGDTGMTGGPAMAEALVQRYGQMVSVAGAGSTLRAVEGLLSSLNDCCRRVHLLLSLGESPLGLPGDLLGLLENVVRTADHINYWVPQRMPPRDRMDSLTQTNGALAASEVVPNPPRESLAECLDDALVRYLQEEGVIEKIDKADDPLALRAIRLVKFCGSGVLIQGKSLNMARARVIEHLRQPQFEEKFLSSLGDAGQAERNLREFHRLLRESGFA
ncbi:hypothetical protein GALL_87570 [mine drainage metagenome]|uniref:HPt domain-containing protein n=1 Tax=mine drainage metagenome TaxID=410659 RepID=A0A1J5TAI1_9ZZZZ